MCVYKCIHTHTELYNSSSTRGGVRIWKGAMGRHKRNNAATAIFWFMYAMEGTEEGRDEAQ